VKRIVMVLTVALVMAAMVVATAAPVFAHERTVPEEAEFGITTAHESMPPQAQGHGQLPHVGHE
jgi:cyclic lactone autoinducer peptide